MSAYKRIVELLSYWPAIIVAAGGVITVLWIGALLWILIALFDGFSGV